MPDPQNGDAKIDVFFIGVGKCGTSWIYKHLSRRGDIGVPKIKEPYVLNSPVEEHAAIIEDLYDDRRPRCDFSNVYYWDESIPNRIVEHNPDAKIVLTVRKPSKRVSSHFGFIQRNGEHVNNSVVEYLQRGDPHDLVKRSDYQEIYDRYSSIIAKDRILVLPLELLSSDVQEYANRLAKFLDVPERVVDESDSQKVLGRSSARMPFVSRSAKKLAEQLRARGYLKLLSGFKESSLVRKLLFSSADAAPDQNFAYEDLPVALRNLDDSYENFLETNR